LAFGQNAFTAKSLVGSHTSGQEQPVVLVPVTPFRGLEFSKLKQMKFTLENQVAFSFSFSMNLF
jgi:hypothetical protein